MFDGGGLVVDLNCCRFCNSSNQRRPRGERIVEHCDLDMITPDGYRVKSQQGVVFRQWVTKILGKHVVKGFELDDRRLKDGRSRCLRELLQHVCDIRSSERNLYQQVTNIYATVIDCDPKASITHTFFA